MCVSYSRRLPQLPQDQTRSWRDFVADAQSIHHGEQLESFYGLIERVSETSARIAPVWIWEAVSIQCRLDHGGLKRAAVSMRASYGEEKDVANARQHTFVPLMLTNILFRCRRTNTRR